MRKYNKDYKLIFVGDATMSPYEILQPGGSVEYNNEEAGAEWMQRLTHAFPKFAWINPEPQGVWQYRQSICGDPAAHEPPHVPGDDGRAGAGDAAAEQIMRAWARGAHVSPRPVTRLQPVPHDHQPHDIDPHMHQHRRQ